jgi:hypothetical protein
VNGIEQLGQHMESDPDLTDLRGGVHAGDGETRVRQQVEPDHGMGEQSIFQ